MKPGSGLALGLVLLGTLFLGLPSTLAAHDIPADITVQLFVKPEGQQLRVLLPVPLGFLHRSDSREAGSEGHHGPSIPAAWRRRARLRVSRESRPGQTRSAVASGGAQVRSPRLPPYPGRNGSSVVPVLSGDSVPAP